MATRLRKRQTFYYIVSLYKDLCKVGMARLELCFVTESGEAFPLRGRWLPVGQTDEVAKMGSNLNPHCRGRRLRRPERGLCKCRWRLELPSVARGVFVSTAESRLQRMLIFSAKGGKYGESRTSIHRSNEKREMSRCSSLFFGPSGET